MPIRTTSGKQANFTAKVGKRCVLRARWGLVKVREQGDKHHALDAAVIASANASLVKRVGDFHRHGKISQRPDGLFVSKSTGEVFEGKEAEKLEKNFPVPWESFRDELLARLDANPVQKLQEINGGTYSASDLESVHPIFVSRAPKRRNTGPVHKETIRSVKYLDEEKSAVKTPLQNLTLKSIEDMVAKSDPRNIGLYEAIKKRLEEYGGDGKKAFADPFYKPSHNGKQGPIVRSIKILSTQKGGVLVRGGIADQASMIRADIFEKKGKFYAVPVYQSDRVVKELPNRAVIAYKSREDWPEMDGSYSFLFSLYPNDVVLLKKKDREYFGYFAGLDVATGAINILSHDRDRDEGKDGLFRGLGIKTAKSIEKFHVDPLGQIFKVEEEVRHGLA